jgi:electron transfer flavoprotein beta subunit
VVKIVVAVKQVVTVDGGLALSEDGAGVTIDYGEANLELNEWDAYSLEAALQVPSSAGTSDHEVVVVTVGDEQTNQALLTCLAMGADRAVRVWDPSLRDVDTLAVARVLARSVARERPDLVLCGAQSADMANGATGVALAGFLDLSHVAIVRSLRCDPTAAIVERELEGGSIEVLRVALPALITVQTGINRPRHPTLRQIKQAPHKPLRVVGLDELELSLETVARAAGSQTVRLSLPDPGRSVMLEGSAAMVARRVIELVQERGGE